MNRKIKLDIWFKRGFIWFLIIYLIFSAIHEDITSFMVGLIVLGFTLLFWLIEKTLTLEKLMGLKK